MKPKGINRRIGGIVAKLHETEKKILRYQQRGIKTKRLEDEELERVEKLLRMEEKRDSL